jgi:hypothetical protein
MIEELNLKDGVDLVDTDTHKKKDLKTRVINAISRACVLNLQFCFLLHQERERFRELGFGVLLSLLQNRFRSSSKSITMRAFTWCSKIPLGLMWKFLTRLSNYRLAMER